MQNLSRALGEGSYQSGRDVSLFPPEVTKKGTSPDYIQATPAYAPWHPDCLIAVQARAFWHAKGACHWHAISWGGQMASRKVEPLEIDTEANSVNDEPDSPEPSEDIVALDEAAPDAEEEQAPKPKRQRRRRKPAETAASTEAADRVETPETAVAVIPATHMQDSLEAIAKQWLAIKEISNGVCTNLERVNSLVKELPSNYATALQEVMKPPAPKAAGITKMAVGFSIAAAILSMLSLSFSQSARQAILSREASAVAMSRNSDSMAPAPHLAAPTPSQPAEIAAVQPAVRRSAPAPARTQPQQRTRAKVRPKY